MSDTVSLRHSLILAGAELSGAECLYSEDMRHGHKVVVLEICNPFPRDMPASGRNMTKNVTLRSVAIYHKQGLGHPILSSLAWRVADPSARGSGRGPMRAGAGEVRETYRVEP